MATQFAGWVRSVNPKQSLQCRDVVLTICYTVYMQQGNTGSGIIKIGQRIMASLEHQIVLADAIREHEPRIKGIHPDEFQNITRSAIIARIWKHEGRKVLAIHPEIVRECQLVSSDKVPVRNLRALPYLSPMVVFPEPPEFESWAAGNDNAGYAVRYRRPESKMRLLGFLTYSNGAMGPDKDIWKQATSTGIEKQIQIGPVQRIHRRPRESMYQTFEQTTFNTHDPQAISFGMLAVLEVCDEYGFHLDSEVTTLSIPFQHRDLTLTEIVDDLLNRFEWTTRRTDGGADERARWMRQLMQTIVGSLFYLCSTALEAERVPRKVAAKIQPGLRKPPEVYKAGWRMGEAITRYRRAQEKLSPLSAPSGNEQLPRHCRAHVRRWPGDTEGVKPMVWVHPYWTHREKLGPEGTNMAHKVPKIGPPGDAGVSMRAVLHMDDPA